MSEKLCKVMPPVVERFLNGTRVYSENEVIEMLTELKDLIDKLPNKRHYITENGVTYGYKDYEPSAKDASQLVQAKINQLKEGRE